MKDLNEAQLLRLYFDFCEYRDIECGGVPKISVEAFYERNRERYS